MSHLAGQGIHSHPKDLQSVKQIQQFDQFSIDTQKRRCTDILCTIIGVLFSLIIIIVSFSIYNHDHYITANFPTDSDGNLCGIHHRGYSYVYFTTANQIKDRLCVSKCPEMNETKLDCRATKSRGCNFNSMEGFEVQQYQAEPFADRNGRFCIPKDYSAREAILAKSKLTSRNIFFNSQDSLITCSLLSALLALIYFIVVQFFPKIVNRFILYIGIGILFILVICTWAYPTNHIKSKVIVGLILLFLLVIVALTVFFFKQAVKANGVFLHQATKFIKDYPIVLINIPIFLGITALFAYILVLELNSIKTHSDLVFQNQKSLYWQYKQGQGGFLTFLWIIQTIWGLSFLKQSFNFIVSSYAVLWYNGYIGSHHQNVSNSQMNRSHAQSSKNHSFCQTFIFPYRIFITKHIGSVIACAFMAAFFKIFDIIFDIFRGNNIHHHNTFCDKIANFFDLVRSESMPYISITGNSYCNSARYCQYLCEQSSALESSQSASRAYRLAAQATLAGLACILSLYIHGRISIFGVGFLYIFSYFIINYFIQMHADTGDGILIVYLQNEQFACRDFLQGTHRSKADFNRDNLRSDYNLKPITKDIIHQLESEELYTDQKHKNRLIQEHSGVKK